MLPSQCVCFLIQSFTICKGNCTFLSFATVKRKVGISILLGVFAFMLGHMLIPHHHHADIADAGLMEKHAGDAEHSDHHHHTIDPFFSLLSYLNNVQAFDFTVFDCDSFPFTGGLVAGTVTTFTLFIDEGSGGIEPPPYWLTLPEGIIDSHGLRGPPLT
jgi:hypothetical protein